MKYKIITLSLLTGFLVNCGMNGDQRVTVQGTTNSNVSLVFQFIYQVEDLCKMDTLVSDYPDAASYNKAVAECTFTKLSTINVPNLCNTPGLTPEQLATCHGLGSVP